MAPIYKLSAQFHPEKDSSGHRIFNRIRFTARHGKDTVHVIDLDVTANPIDGTIIVLLAGSNPEMAIRANQALKLGEPVELGMHDADVLAELGFRELNE